MYADRIMTAKIIVGSLSLAYMCQKMIFEVGNDIILLFLCTENFHQWNWLVYECEKELFFLFTHHVVMQTFFQLFTKKNEKNFIFLVHKDIWPLTGALLRERDDDEKYFCEWFYRHNKSKYQAEINKTFFLCLYHRL